MASTSDPYALLERLARPLANDSYSDVAKAAYRREVTRTDPLAFALIYLRHHLRGKEDGARITLSEVHLDWVESAKAWMEPSTEPYAHRKAEVGPREVGKSTWWFLILPLWAAAHGHASFTAAFAATSTQAETHLATFKSELDTNPLIREDYPDLVAPKTRGRGTVEADRVSLYHARSGFVFAASGMDSSNLGLKVGSKRPDLIVLDDIEPDEARYSPTLAAKRLGTLRDAILPLNIYARVILVGTVTMPGSIVHQVVRWGRGERDPADDRNGNAWVGEERFEAHHYPAIATNPDGSRRSVWPAKWSLAFLEGIEHTRTYAKNYANDPVGADGDYWRLEDFEHDYEALDAAVTHEVISVDPAVTSKDSSDYTGLASVGCALTLKRCVVYEARQVKLDPASLRLQVIGQVERALERGHAVIVLVETNQGGELWGRLLWGLPVRIKTVHQTVKKEVRAASALDHYQRHRVKHVPGLRDLEAQMAAFPNAPHDDLVDAVGSGVAYFLDRGKKRKASMESQSYAK